MISEAQQSPSDIVFSASSSESTSSVPCGICHRQFSRYTCPKCNLQYCSLICFRSQAHSDCSEGFYKNELEADIRTNPSQSNEERRRMLELLKRFEEEAAEDEDALLEREEDEDDLASRLGTLDLDGVSYDQLWEVLTPAERQKFLGALNDPSSDIAQSLLASEDLDEQITLPWWDTPQGDTSHSDTLLKRYGHRPQMLDIPEATLHAAQNASTSGPSLLFNIFAVLVSYAYITRTLSVSPLSSLSLEDPELLEAKRLFSTLVPFLTDRKSTAVLPSLSGLITDLWSRFDANTMTPALFALIMRDAAKLLQPAAIVAVSHPTGQRLEDHRSANALLALSDISTLFQKAKRSATDNLKKAPTNPVTAKLAFYAARIANTPPSVLSALSSEALARAKLVEREGESEKTPGQGIEGDARKRVSINEHTGHMTSPRIVELS